MQCHVCGSQFVSASALSKHRQQHEKTWKCGICDQRFSRKDRMDCHVAGHSSTKLYHFWLLGDTIYGLCQHQKRAYVISQHPFESMIYAIFLTVHMIHSYLSYCDISTRLRNSAYLPSTSSCPHTKVYNVYYTTTIIIIMVAFI